MTWGSFSNTHLLTLGLALLVNILIYLILKRNTRKKQILALFIFSLFGVGFIVYEMLSSGADILKHLPLSFEMISIILLPIAILTRWKRLCNLLLVWSAGSILALVFNSSMAHLELPTFEFVTYFTMHLFGAGIPILLFELNLVRRETKTIKPTVIFTLIMYTAIHLFNLIVNNVNGWSVANGVNYMSTLAPTTATLDFFYAIIPSAYWYMILALPLFLLYVLYWYLPEILDNRRRRRPLRKKLDDIDKYYDNLEDEYIDRIIKKHHG